MSAVRYQHIRRHSDDQVRVPYTAIKGLIYRLAVNSYSLRSFCRKPEPNKTVRNIFTVYVIWLVCFKILGLLYQALCSITSLRCGKYCFIWWTDRVNTKNPRHVHLINNFTDFYGVEYRLTTLYTHDLYVVPLSEPCKMAMIDFAFRGSWSDISKQVYKSEILNTA